MAVRASGSIAIGIALGVLAAGAACGRSREVEAAPPVAGSSAAPVLPAAPATPPRTVAAASGESITRRLVIDAHLMVERDVGVTTRRDGVIQSILADRGQRVKENQPLARLEHGDLQLSEKAAELELKKEQSSFERAGKLSDQKILSEEEFELARLRRDAAEKNLERIRYELEKCVILAPFDGVISGRFVEKGQVIREDDRRVLFQVTAMGPLLARVYVPEWALFGLRSGQNALVTSTGSPVGGPGDGAPGIEARLRWINDVLDAASGSAEVLVEILGGPGAVRLRPGMSVQVGFDLVFGPGSAKSPLISLPREALGPEEPRPGQQVELEVIGPGGEVTRRPVVLGFVGDRRVEIRSGLSAGDKVVVGSR
jgi:membrane fusion protein, multidrug efflux system